MIANTRTSFQLYSHVSVADACSSLFYSDSKSPFPANYHSQSVVLSGVHRASLPRQKRSKLSLELRRHCVRKMYTSLDHSMHVFLPEDQPKQDTLSSTNTHMDQGAEHAMRVGQWHKIIRCDSEAVTQLHQQACLIIGASAE